MTTDPIVAPATSWGRAALAVIRVSGTSIGSVIDRVVRPKAGLLEPDRPRRVELVACGEVVDDGVAVLRRGPRTATGEDLLEVTTHGNPLIVEQLVEAFVEAGARVAQPGEFTRRAVLNGKLDLVAAEAVNQVVRATTPGGLRLGRAGLTGALGARIDRVRDDLVGVVAELEARLDYPADELALRADRDLDEVLAGTAARCRDLAESYRAGRALVEGVRVALVGEVNAGKSSLFNRLVGKPRALVSSAAGTTRDVVEARARLGPLEVTLWDTAGERATDDPLEAAGLALARELVEGADLLVVVLRARCGGPSETEQEILSRTATQPRVIAYNGVDRADADPPPREAVGTSAVTGEGLSVLIDAIVEGAGVSSGEALVASVRQRDLLLQVAQAATDARGALPIAGVAVAAECVLEGMSSIDELTGADTREDVLDAVFSRFCIGK